MKHKYMLAFPGNTMMWVTIQWITHETAKAMADDGVDVRRIIPWYERAFNFMMGQ